MPVARKTTVRKTANTPVEEALSTPKTSTKGTLSLFQAKSLFKKVPMPKSYVPVLVVLLIIASFLLGMLVTKIQYLEGSTSGSAQVAQQPATAPQAGAKVTVDVGNLPLMGNKNAKVKVIEFADFQCPFCKQWFTDVESNLIKDYVNTGKVAFYWRDYPFLGSESNLAANAARCANEQGKFWEFHDYLYQHQGQENSGTFSADNLKQFGAAIGLNTDQFNSCIDSGKYNADASKDMAAGQKAGVSGTPTVFINGTPVVGAQPYTSFKTILDQELAKNK